MNAISPNLISNVCDCIPGVSLFSNLVELFVKYVVLPRKTPEEIKANRFYQHLEAKAGWQHPLLAIFSIFAKIFIWLFQKPATEKVVEEPVRLKPVVYLKNLEPQPSLASQASSAASGIAQGMKPVGNLMLLPFLPLINALRSS